MSFAVVGDLVQRGGCSDHLFTPSVHDVCNHQLHLPVIYHQLHSPVIYAGRADRKDSTVQQNLCRLTEALQAMILCYFILLIEPKLKKY